MALSRSLIAAGDGGFQGAVVVAAVIGDPLNELPDSCELPACFTRQIHIAHPKIY
jgi:hypothetical protein